MNSSSYSTHPHNEANHISYHWSCQVCGFVNTPESTQCASCNCPAEVSGAEIDKFKQINQLEPSSDIKMLFTVSTEKLIVMSVCTFNLYLVFWFYKNWQQIKKQTPGSTLMPFMRALFSPFFAYRCFQIIKETVDRNELNIHFSAGFLAVSFFLLNLANKLPAPTIYW